MNTPTTNQWQGPGDDRTVHIPARGSFGPPPVDTRSPFAGGGYPQTCSAAPVYPPVGWSTTVPTRRRRKVWPFAAAGVALVVTLVGVTVLATHGGDPAGMPSQPPGRPLNPLPQPLPKHRRWWCRHLPSRAFSSPCPRWRPWLVRRRWPAPRT